MVLQRFYRYTFVQCAMYCTHGLSNGHESTLAAVVYLGNPPLVVLALPDGHFGVGWAAIGSSGGNGRVPGKTRPVAKERGQGRAPPRRFGWTQKTPHLLRFANQMLRSG